MKLLDRLRRHANENRTIKPAIIAALDELGVTGRIASKYIGISETTYSLWKSGITKIPEKHLPTLHGLAHEVTSVLLEVAEKDISYRKHTNKIKVARAQKLLDSESEEKS